MTAKAFVDLEYELIHSNSPTIRKEFDLLADLNPQSPAILSIKNQVDYCKVTLNKNDIITKTDYRTNKTVAINADNSTYLRSRDLLVKLAKKIYTPLPKKVFTKKYYKENYDLELENMLPFGYNQYWGNKISINKGTEIKTKEINVEHVVPKFVYGKSNITFVEDIYNIFLAPKLINTYRGYLAYGYVDVPNIIFDPNGKPVVFKNTMNYSYNNCSKMKCDVNTISEQSVLTHNMFINKQNEVIVPKGLTITDYHKIYNKSGDHTIKIVDDESYEEKNNPAIHLVRWRDIPSNYNSIDKWEILGKDKYMYMKIGTSSYACETIFLNERVKTCVIEPLTSEKGIIARTLLYVHVIYNLLSVKLDVESRVEYTTKDLALEHYNSLLKKYSADNNLTFDEYKEAFANYQPSITEYNIYINEIAPSTKATNGKYGEYLTAAKEQADKTRIKYDEYNRIRKTKISLDNYLKDRPYLIMPSFSQYIEQSGGASNLSEFPPLYIYYNPKRQIELLGEQHINKEVFERHFAPGKILLYETWNKNYPPRSEEIFDTVNIAKIYGYLNPFVMYSSGNKLIWNSNLFRELINGTIKEINIMPNLDINLDAFLNFDAVNLLNNYSKDKDYSALYVMKEISPLEKLLNMINPDTNKLLSTLSETEKEQVAKKYSTYVKIIYDKFVKLGINPVNGYKIKNLTVLKRYDYVAPLMELVKYISQSSYDQYVKKYAKINITVPGYQTTWTGENRDDYNNMIRNMRLNNRQKDSMIKKLSVMNRTTLLQKHIDWEQISDSLERNLDPKTGKQITDLTKAEYESMVSSNKDWLRFFPMIRPYNEPSNVTTTVSKPARGTNLQTGTPQNVEIVNKEPVTAKTVVTRPDGSVVVFSKNR